MFRKKPDEQLRATLAIASSMSGLWLLGVVALALAPSGGAFPYAEGLVNFGNQATSLGGLIETMDLQWMLTWAGPTTL